MTFKETDIRPDHLMKGQFECFAADIKCLLENSDKFVPVNCPACDSKTSDKTFTKDGLTFLICSNCLTMYINPRPTSSLLDNLYANSEAYRYQNKYTFPASEATRREKIFRPRAERVVHFCQLYGIENATLLEVGSGFGIFCEIAQDLRVFDHVIAVEPVSFLAETCRQKGLEVIEKPIEKARFEINSIDIVTSFEVIEHLFSPQTFLMDCASVLSPNGLLILSCPNAKGFDINVLQALSNTVNYQHLNYFNPVSLSHLVTRCGFNVLEILTPGQLDAELVRKKILSAELDVSSRPFLKQVLIDEWEQTGKSFQNFLTDNLLSSHMWIVARKSD